MFLIDFFKKCNIIFSTDEIGHIMEIHSENDTERMKIELVKLLDYVKISLTMSM